MSAKGPGRTSRSLPYQASPGLRLGELLLLPLRGDLDDVPGQAEAAHRADHEPGRVDLPPTQPVEGRAGEGVVVVVPGLAERRRRQPPDVGRVVVGLEATSPVEVADRVDAPRDVVDEEDPHQPTPEQGGETAGERAGESPADRE